MTQALPLALAAELERGRIVDDNDAGKHGGPGERTGERAAQGLPRCHLMIAE